MIFESLWHNTYCIAVEKLTVSRTLNLCATCIRWISSEYKGILQVATEYKCTLVIAAKCKGTLLIAAEHKILYRSLKMKPKLEMKYQVSFQCHSIATRTYKQLDKENFVYARWCYAVVSVDKLEFEYLLSIYFHIYMMCVKKYVSCKYKKKFWQINVAFHEPFRALFDNVLLKICLIYKVVLVCDV